MKKQSKTVQLALGGLVVLIWGLVAYRFRRLASGAPAQAENASFVPPAPIAGLEQDTYHLLVNYPDPFLSGASVVGERKASNAAGSAAPAAQTSTTKPTLGAVPPPIQYKGFSRDSEGRMRARFTVNGKGVTLANGEAFGNLNVLSVFKDSVQINWEGKKYTLRRQKAR
jgi:hypothetical protein